MSRDITITPVDPERFIRSGSYYIDDDKIQARIDRVTGRWERLWIHPVTLNVVGCIVFRPWRRSMCWYDNNGALVHRVVLGGDA